MVQKLELSKNVNIKLFPEKSLLGLLEKYKKTLNHADFLAKI